MVIMKYPRLWLTVTLLLLGVSLLGSQIGAASATSFPQSCYTSFSWNYGYFDYYYGYYPYYSYPYYSNPYYNCGYTYYDNYGNYGNYGYPYYYGYYAGSYYYTPSKYQLMINTDPVNLAQVTGTGSYSEGSTASFGVSKTMIQVSPDTRYVFSRWSGDYSGVGSSATLTMDGSKNVTAVYQLQFRLRLDAKPSSVPVPQGDGWYNAGDSVALGASTILGGDNGSRLIFTGWSVDGKNTAAGTSLTLKMDAPHTATANYQQQYYLKVMSDQGIPYGEGWYNAGSAAQIYVSTPISTSYGVSIVFNGWQGDFQSNTQSAKVLMDMPKTVIATWGTDATILDFTIVIGIIGVLAVVSAAVFLFLRRKTPSGATNATTVQYSA
jgi:hypothetical protein